MLYDLFITIQVSMNVKHISGRSLSLKSHDLVAFSGVEVLV